MGRALRYALMLATALSCVTTCVMTCVAQSPVGSVSVADADVTPKSQTVAGKVLLPANSTITAHDHTAEVNLEHHGLVLVCATTALHVADSPDQFGPLMLTMDRGALEMRIETHSGDELLTPDLRIEADHTASLDLAVRVARNGDTCIENRASTPDAPTLQIHEQFGDGEYMLHPGQHVLFNGGSLRQVVDNEPSPCGCPPTPESLVADAGKGKTNAQKYPFPLAQSEGLAPTPPPAPTPPGETQVTLSANMGVNGNDLAAQPPLPPQKHGFFGSIGNFFKKIFGGH